jgi:hypothetical protein
MSNSRKASGSTSTQVTENLMQTLKLRLTRLMAFVNSEAGRSLPLSSREEASMHTGTALRSLNVWNGLHLPESLNPALLNMDYELTLAEQQIYLLSFAHRAHLTGNCETTQDLLAAMNSWSGQCPFEEWLVTSQRIRTERALDQFLAQRGLRN